jgi:hypothetical protein
MMVVVFSWRPIFFRKAAAAFATDMPANSCSRTAVITSPVMGTSLERGAAGASPTGRFMSLRRLSRVRWSSAICRSISATAASKARLPSTASGMAHPLGRLAEILARCVRGCQARRGGLFATRGWSPRIATSRGAYWGFVQRVLAAFRAICFRLRADNFLALALPPLSPPLRRASVAGVSGLAGGSWVSPVAKSTTSLASWFGSRGRGGCFAMGREYATDCEPGS